MFLYSISTDNTPLLRTDHRAILGIKIKEKEYLHCIFSVATLEVTVSIALLATHRYRFPLSVLLTFVIVNCLLSDDKLIAGLAVVFTADPFMVHETFGTGFPIALQDKVAFFPSSTVRLSG